MWKTTGLPSYYVYSAFLILTAAWQSARYRVVLFHKHMVRMINIVSPTGLADVVQHCITDFILLIILAEVDKHIFLTKRLKNDSFSIRSSAYFHINEPFVIEPGVDISHWLHTDACSISWLSVTFQWSTPSSAVCDTATRGLFSGLMFQSAVVRVPAIVWPRCGYVAARLTHPPDQDTQHSARWATCHLQNVR